MNNIKELSLEEIALVSGGNANGNFERNTGSSSYNAGKSSNSGGAPITPANVAGMTIIAGTLTFVASAINPVAGAAVGTILSAGIAGATTSSGSSSNNSGGSWNDTNPGGMVGECRW
ncbi:hypothetical protein MUA03_11650 [Enterobacteriaceae bacterium H16N7]|nr:hypothetical protein [Dryocola clanedunensis]